MAKTRNHSVRFEESDFQFICKRENLKTAQQIVSFLMSNYLKLYRIEKPSVFDIPKEMKEQGEALGKDISAKHLSSYGNSGTIQRETFEETDPLQSWKNEMNNCESLDELNQIGQRIASSGLSRLEQNIMNKYGKMICDKKGFL